MEIFDLIPTRDLEGLIAKCDLLITHGGVGSIMSGIKAGKKVIAAARLSEYGEHTNNHQQQIISEFSKDGYILELKDFSKLEDVIKKSKTFKPKVFESNTNNMINLIKNFIENN